MRLRCINCGRFAHYDRPRRTLTSGAGFCPRHPSGAHYLCIYENWPWWKPAWLWTRQHVLWPFFEYEVCARAGRTLTKKLEKRA